MLEFQGMKRPVDELADLFQPEVKTTRFEWTVVSEHNTCDEAYAERDRLIDFDGDCRYAVQPQPGPLPWKVVTR